MIVQKPITLTLFIACTETLDVNMFTTIQLKLITFTLNKDCTETKNFNSVV